MPPFAPAVAWCRPTASTSGPVPAASASHSTSTASDGYPLALAGLWESHDEFGPTFTIITTAPNAYMSTIHTRMPVVLEPGDWNAWLAAEHEDPAWRAALLRPAADHVLTGYPVSPAVNSVANNGPHLLESAAIQPLL